MSVLESRSRGSPSPPLPAWLPLAAPSPIFKQPLHGKWEIPLWRAADTDAPGEFGITQGRCSARLQPRLGPAAGGSVQVTGFPR